MTTITANVTSGVYLSSPPDTNPVVVNPGVTVSSTQNGVTGFVGAWTIANNGSIIAPGYSGIYLGAGGSVTNAASASISGYDGVNFRGGVGTVTNLGTIAGSSQHSIGVVLAAGGSVINQGGGTISGYSGVALTAGGMITNAVSASIIGVYDGIGISGAVGSVVNRGHIAGTGAGGVGIVLGSGGSITNAVSASISGTTVGVDLSKGGTLTDAGTIVGNSGTAVVFGGTGSNLLILDPGYHLSGIVSGGTSAINMLELASASSTGTLSGLGTAFVSFTQTTIDPDAHWTLTGANILVAGSTLTELSGSTLTFTSTLINDGMIIVDPSMLTVANMIGTGSVIIESGSTLEIQTALASSNTIQFGGIGAYLHLDTPGSAAATVTNFGPGETIDLKGIDPLSVSFISGTLGFSTGMLSLSLALPGIILATPSGDGTAVTALSLCFCINTMVATPSGERLVQELAVGDLVLTHGGTPRPIAWIGTGRLLATRGQRSAATPVVVQRHALATNAPHCDLRLTKGHALYLDGVLIPVEELVNHRSIFWDDHAQEVELYHLELHTHDVLIANGVPAESYRDDGNRWLFQTYNPRRHLPRQAPCAPLLNEGPVVDAVWRRLLERAGPPRGMPLTEAADPHLIVDGRRVDALEHREDGTRVFHLGAKPRQVRLVSRAAVPQELGIARDPRMLGVAVRRIVLQETRRQWVIEPDADVLAEGFHSFEQVNGWRWTDGDAVLPAELFARMTGPAMLMVWIGGTMRYPDDGFLCVA